MTRTKKKRRLYRAVLSILENYPNVHQMEVTEEWPYGLAYRILEGGYSPTLDKIIHPPRKRKRTIINGVAPERFKAQCKRREIKPGEHFNDLMDLWEGIGNLNV